MTLSDACLEHVKRRNKVRKGDSILFLVSIPPRILRGMSLEDLILARNIALSGLMVCGDCVAMCRANLDCPAVYKSSRFRGVVDWRNREDSKVKRMINDELARRKNLLMARLERL